MVLKILYFLSLLFVSAFAGTLNDSTTLVNDLLSKHNKNVRPVADHRNKTYVGVYAYLKSIQEFDEVKEVFTYTAGFSIHWHDAGMVWDPDAYGGVDDVKISYRKVWTPDLILTTPSDEMDSFGKPWQMVDYSNDGKAGWTPGRLIKSTCSVDVSMYPFDKQTCKSDFNVWGYDSDEVEMYTFSDKADTTLYSDNVAWILEGSNVAVTTTGGWSQLEVTFFLRRKPSFIVVNIIMPILFLSLINVLVFILVPESGERVSYCITVLLAIAVFMTIISDTLPKSSEPLPIISYKLMVDMVLSSLITLVTILNLRLYNKDDKIPVPAWLKAGYEFLFRPKKCKVEKISQKVHPKTLDVMVLADIDEMDLVDNKNAIEKKRHSIKQMPDSVNVRLERLISESGLVSPDVTWKDISRLVDCVSLLVFTILSILSFAVFLLYVSQG